MRGHSANQLTLAVKKVIAHNKACSELKMRDFFLSDVIHELQKLKPRAKPVKDVARVA